MGLGLVIPFVTWQVEVVQNFNGLYKQFRFSKLLDEVSRMHYAVHAGKKLASVSISRALLAWDLDACNCARVLDVTEILSTRYFRLSNQDVIRFLCKNFLIVCIRSGTAYRYILWRVSELTALRGPLSAPLRPAS